MCECGSISAILCQIQEFQQQQQWHQPKEDKQKPRTKNDITCDGYTNIDCMTKKNDLM